MSRPQPKELVVSDGSVNTITIVASTADAESWIEREAPNYGNLIPCTAANNSTRYLLFVAETFDPAEVAAYLRSYNS